MPDRLYCTLQEVLTDLGLHGEKVSFTEETLMKDIKAASDYIDLRIGRFIPRTETRKMDGPGGIDLQLLEPLLTNEADTTVIDDGETLDHKKIYFGK